MANSELKFSAGNLLKIAFPILVLFGSIELIVYYNQFSIHILDYLDFNEIITSFLNNMYFNIVYVMFFVFFMLSSSKTGVYSFLALFLFFVINFFLTEIEDFAFIISMKALVFEITLLVFIGIFEWLLLNNIKDDVKYWIIATLSIFVLLTTLSIDGEERATYVKDKHIFNGTKLYYGGKEIISTSSFYYIGKTHGDVFFYNSIDSSTVIYPIDKIDSIILKIKGVERKLIHPLDRR